jgi:hypothetical protein
VPSAGETLCSPSLKRRTLLAGIGPLACSPYPSAGGIQTIHSSPGRISFKASVKPGEPERITKYWSPLGVVTTFLAAAFRARKPGPGAVAGGVGAVGTVAHAPARNSTKAAMISLVIAASVPINSEMKTVRLRPAQETVTCATSAVDCKRKPQTALSCWCQFLALAHRCDHARPRRSRGGNTSLHVTNPSQQPLLLARHGKHMEQT